MRTALVEQYLADGDHLDHCPGGAVFSTDSEEAIVYLVRTLVWW